jgi:hypothetical protein
MRIALKLVTLMIRYYAPNVTKIFHQPYGFVNHVLTRTSPSRKAKLNAVKKNRKDFYDREMSAQRNGPLKKMRHQIIHTNTDSVCEHFRKNFEQMAH